MKMRLPPSVSCVIDGPTKNLSGFSVERLQMFEESVTESNP